MPQKSPRPRTEKQAGRYRPRDEGGLLTVEEAAELLITSPDTVRAWVREGLLPAIRRGRLTYLRGDDVEAFIHAARQG